MVIPGRGRRWSSSLMLTLALAACSGSSTTASPADGPAEAAEPEDANAEAAEPEAKAEATEPEAKAEATEPEAKTEKAEKAEPERSADDPALVELMRSRPPLALLMEDPDRYRFQVLVTVIEPGKDGPTVVEHGYRVDAEYIYPASAIKTFASVAALLRLKELRAEGHRVGLHTPMAYCEGDSKRCHDEDESNVDSGTITVGHEIRKMQLVSNNHAFNRLYELAGHRYINETMWALGFSTLRVHHRMYGVHDETAQRTTPRIELRPKRGRAVVVPARVSDLQMPPTDSHDMQLGVGYISDETHALVEEPLDFSRKNYVSVRDLHKLTLALTRPELPRVPDLGLDPKDREFLLEAMVDDALESENPVYTNPRASGLRYHTLSKGMMTVIPIERVYYAGKAGKAYGFHLDNAYIEDTKTKRAIVVTVVGYANDNGVLNDNKYEYDEVTRPMLKNLGIVMGRVLLGEAL